MEQTERKAVFYDGAKYNYFGAGVRAVCAELNTLIAELKKKDFLHVDVNDALCSNLCNGEFAFVVNAYIRHITQYLEQTNPLLIDTAVNISFSKKDELTNILLSFQENANKHFRSYGSLYEAQTAIVYDAKEKAFKVNETELKERCTGYVKGEKMALFERVQRAIEEIEAIQSECNKYGFDFLADGSANANALIDVNVDGTLQTHFEKMIN